MLLLADKFFLLLWSDTRERTEQIFTGFPSCLVHPSLFLGVHRWSNNTPLHNSCHCQSPPKNNFQNHTHHTHCQTPNNISHCQTPPHNNFHGHTCPKNDFLNTRHPRAPFTSSTQRLCWSQSRACRTPTCCSAPRRTWPGQSSTDQPVGCFTEARGALPMKSRKNFVKIYIS